MLVRWLAIFGVIYLACCPEYIFAATDTPTRSPTLYPTLNPSQSNWKQTPLPYNSQDPGNGKLVAIGYNGQNVAIASNYGLYVSTDYGNTFQWAQYQNYNAENPDPAYTMTSPWSSVVSDSSGTLMYAISGGELWFSNGNIVNSWAMQTYIGQLIDVAVESTGTYLYGLPTEENLYSSSCTAGQLNTATNVYKTATFTINSCNRIMTDSTGNYVLVTGQDVGHIALSTNAGTSFTVYSLPYSVTTYNGYVFSGISYTDSNFYVYIPYNRDSIEISNTGGKTFSTHLTMKTSYWNATMMVASGNGEYVLFGGAVKPGTMNAEIYASSNYGVSFNSAFPTTSDIITGGAISSTGTSMYVVAGASLYSYQQVPESPMPSHTPTGAPTTHWISTTVTASSSYGFTAVAMNNDGSCITIGASDGQTLFTRQSLGGPFTSWVSPSSTSSHAFTSISMSITGQYQIALNNGTSVYLSDNYGSSWTTTSGSLNYNGAGWSYSAMSNNGYLILLGQGTSTLAIYNGNSALSSGSWSPTFKIFIPLEKSTGIVGVAMDSDGSTFAFMTTAGEMYISHNYGYSWKSTYGVTTYPLMSFTASRSNALQYLIGAMMGFNMVTQSTDQGKYWFNIPGPNSPTNIWQSLASSYSGLYVLGGVTHGAYDTTSDAQDGVYYSNNYGFSWTMIFSLQNPVVAINPAGNYMIAVSGDVGSTQMYYYSQAVPTTSPTMYPPTMQPSQSNAPYVPITNYIEGFVTRNQYDSNSHSCKGDPFSVTGFGTDICLPIDNSPNVLSVKYTCDTDSIIMTEYSDSSCQTALPNVRSYKNGEHFYDGNGNCKMQIKCNTGSVASDVLPNKPYGVTQYYTDYNCNAVSYFYSVINNVCINTEYDTTLTNNNIYSIEMQYPTLYEYSDTQCTFFYDFVSFGGESCMYSGADSEITQHHTESFAAPAISVRQHFDLGLPRFDSSNRAESIADFSVARDVDHFRSLLKRTKGHNGMDKTSNGLRNKKASSQKMVKPEVYLDDIWYAIDDVPHEIVYYSSFLTVPSSNSNSSLSGGSIAGIVIGVIVAIGIAAGLVYYFFVFRTVNGGVKQPSKAIDEGVGMTSTSPTNPDAVEVPSMQVNTISPNTNNTYGATPPQQAMPIASPSTPTQRAMPIASPSMPMVMSAPAGNPLMYTMGPSGNLVPMNNGGNMVYVMNPGTNTMAPMMMPMNAAPMVMNNGQPMIYNTAVNPMFVSQQQPVMMMVMNADGTMQPMPMMTQAMPLQQATPADPNSAQK